jgi:hypothetical protein
MPIAWLERGRDAKPTKNTVVFSLEYSLFPIVGFYVYDT